MMRQKFLCFRQRMSQTIRRWANQYASEWPYVRLYLLKLPLRVAYWMRFGVIVFMWISFECYQRVWSFLQVFWEDLTGRRSTKAHRALFCLGVSLIIGQLIVLTFLPFLCGPWSILFWMAHGVVVHTYWERGLRWCRYQLGLRQLGSYEGLDLGN